MHFGPALPKLGTNVSRRPDLFESLIQPCTDAELEARALDARRLTRQHFGATMRFFAPLYLSNECINSCRYCGFSRENPILRVTLTLDQVETEVRHLLEKGFRNFLLVAGEHPRFVGRDYLAECVRRLRALGVPSINLEVGPMETEDYRSIVEAGAEGLIVYQETYNREVYAAMHLAGPKKDYDARLACPRRAYEAGFRRIGLGALFGLADWREEALALARHLDELLAICWKAFFTVSAPRLRPAAGEFEPLVHVTDRDLTQFVIAMRIAFPQVGIVLSTRESPTLRDGLACVGITAMSAGSHTEPGGYTGAGRDDLHRTSHGCRVELPKDRVPSEGEQATEQFAIADRRSVEEVAVRVRELGLEPVWKDWDPALTAAPVGSQSPRACRWFPPA